MLHKKLIEFFQLNGLHLNETSVDPGDPHTISKVTLEIVYYPTKEIDKILSENIKILQIMHNTFDDKLHSNPSVNKACLHLQKAYENYQALLKLSK